MRRELHERLLRIVDWAVFFLVTVPTAVILVVTLVIIVLDTIDP